MRKYVIPQNMSVEYLLGDHLGSTSLTTDTAGNKISEMRYKPWGEVRYTWKNSDPEIIPSAYALTRQTFTDQYSYADDPSTAGVEGFGLMFYQSRFYDPSLGRFASADSIVPAGVQGLDRYAYVNNNPIRYTDPTGHKGCDNLDENEACYDAEKIYDITENIEKNYKVKISGKWSASEINAFQTMLSKLAASMGGIDEVNQMISSTLQNNGSSRGYIVASRQKAPAACPNSACWDDKTNTLYFSDKVFTSTYQAGRKNRRPVSLGFDPRTASGLDLSIQASMAHEMGHVYADAYPSASSQYIVDVSDHWAFTPPFGATTVNKAIGAAEESMATAMAIYVVSGGAPYPQHQNQMDFIANLFSQ